MSLAGADGLVWYLRMVGEFVEQSNRRYYKMSVLSAVPSRPLVSGVADDLTRPDHFDLMCQWAASAENYATLALTAIQLQELKAVNGEYPVPSVFDAPLDLLTGEPISYSSMVDGFTLSVKQIGYEGGSSEAEWEW